MFLLEKDLSKEKEIMRGGYEGVTFILTILIKKMRYYD